MRNLLWKFVALAGVAGLGFLAIFQAMETLSIDSKIGPQPANASQSPPALVASPANSAAEIPPLETRETVATGHKFPQVAEIPPIENAQEFPAPEPFSTSEQPAPEASFAQVPFPEPIPAAPEPAVGNPFEIPGAQTVATESAKPTEIVPVSATPPVPAAEELPPLPEFIPAAKANEAPNLDVFSAPIPALTPPESPVPVADNTGNPFAVPTPSPEESPAPIIEQPFDPYEAAPAPAAEVPKPTPAPSANNELPPLAFPEPTPVSEPTPAPAPAALPSLNFPPAEPTPPPTAEALPAPTPVVLPVEEAPQSAPFAPEPVGFPVPASVSEAVDPLDLNIPTASPVPQPTTTPEPKLGTANVAIPLAPPADDQALFTNLPAESPETVPLPLPASRPYEDEPGSLAPPKQVDVKPLPASPIPDLTAPPHPSSLANSKGPACAVPETIQQAGHKETDTVPSADLLEGVGTVGNVAAAAQQPELRIQKVAPPKAALNQPMIYNILVRNVGTVAAHQVVVEDQVPKGTRLTGTIPRGEMADTRLIWRLDSIKPGEEKKIAVRVIPTQEGQVGSVAKVSFVAEVAAKTVIAAPKLSLEFTGPPKAVLGDPVTYRFKVANLGSGDASKVFLRNLLPEGLTHPDGNDLEYEVGTLKAGQSKEIDLTVNASKAGDFINKAIASADGGLRKESSTALKIIGNRLLITRTGPKRRYIGRMASYSNTIANQTQTRVAPVEVVPVGMDFLKASDGGQFDPRKRTVTWALAELPANAEQKLQLDLMARKEGAQASEVTAYDPNGTRAVVKSETVIDGYTALRLDVKEYAEPVDVGEQVALRIVAFNRGTQTTTDVVLKMQLPEETEFVSAKGPVDYTLDGRTLTFKPLDSLKGRTEIEFELVLKPVKSGDARLQLEISSDQVTQPLKRDEGIRILAKRP